MGDAGAGFGRAHAGVNEQQRGESGMYNTEANKSNGKKECIGDVGSVTEDKR